MIFSQRHQITAVLWPDDDAIDGNPASDVVSFASYRFATFHVAIGAGGTGTGTITVEKCTAADGTGATAVAFKYRKATSEDAYGALTDATASGFTTSAGTNDQYIIEIDGNSLGENYGFARLKFTEVANSPIFAAATAIMSGASLMTDIMPTCLA